VTIDNFSRRQFLKAGGISVLGVLASRANAWSNQNHHFTLYDDVDETLRTLKARGLQLGLITNGHRSLSAFQTHFELDGLIDVTLSSRQHGYMKPHASIFRAALELAQVAAADAVMVGDSYSHDVAGAESVGMRGVLIARGGNPPDGITAPVIQSLTELLAIV